MKSYTDIEQSHKLAEFLPLESADMCYPIDAFSVHYDKEPVCHYTGIGLAHPCWSLAALLGVLPYPSLHKTFSGWRCDSYDKEGKTCKLGENADNPIDACYEMIVKLHELKRL